MSDTVIHFDGGALRFDMSPCCVSILFVMRNRPSTLPEPSKQAAGFVALALAQEAALVRLTHGAGVFDLALGEGLVALGEGGGVSVAGGFVGVAVAGREVCSGARVGRPGLHPSRPIKATHVHNVSKSLSSFTGITQLQVSPKDSPTVVRCQSRPG